MEEEDNSYSDFLSSISYEFTLIISIIWTIIGFTGNSIVVVVLIKPKFRNLPIYRYLIVANITDIAVLATMWPYTLPSSMNDDRIKCKLSNYFGNLLYDFSSWINVTILLDRLLSVKFSTRFKFRSQLKYQMLALLFFFVFLVFFNIPTLLLYDLNSDSNTTTICSTSNPYDQFLVDFSTFAISLIVPIIIMTSCTFSIGRHLIQNKMRLSNNRIGFRKEIHLIKVMTAMNGFFLICNSPFFIQLTVFDLFNYNGETFYYQNIVYNTTNMLAYFQNTSGFLLCFAFNKVFREYFSSLIRHKKNKVTPLRQIKVHPS